MFIAYTLSIVNIYMSFNCQNNLFCKFVFILLLWLYTSQLRSINVSGTNGIVYTEEHL